MTIKRNLGRSAVRLALICAFAWAICAPTVSFAQTAMHEISWAYASPQDVDHFVVYIAVQNGDATGARQLNVGRPPSQPTSGGTMHVFRAIVSAELTEFVAVGAVGWDGRVSPLSAWSPLPPSQPGQPLLVP